VPAPQPEYRQPEPHPEPLPEALTSPDPVPARKCVSGGEQARVSHAPVLRLVTRETVAGAAGPEHVPAWQL